MTTEERGTRKLGKGGYSIGMEGRWENCIGMEGGVGGLYSRKKIQNKEDRKNNMEKMK